MNHVGRYLDAVEQQRMRGSITELEAHKLWVLADAYADAAAVHQCAIDGQGAFTTADANAKMETAKAELRAFIEGLTK